MESFYNVWILYTFTYTSHQCYNTYYSKVIQHYVWQLKVQQCQYSIHIFCHSYSIDYHPVSDVEWDWSAIGHVSMPRYNKEAAAAAWERMSGLQGQQDSFTSFLSFLGWFGNFATPSDFFFNVLDDSNSNSLSHITYSKASWKETQATILYSQKTIWPVRSHCV